MRRHLVILVCAVAVLVLCVSWIISATTDKNDKTLVLTHIIFRHGDRTPERLTNFPNNPYKNETYHPFGIGQLTLKGKQRIYKLGKALRKRYSNFLGPLYYTDLVEAVSSDYIRAITSLQTFMIAMFPPTKEFELEEGIPWQPVYYTYLKKEQDDLIGLFRQIFPRLQALSISLDEEELKVCKDLSEKTGLDVTKAFSIMTVQNIMEVFDQLGYQLPEWIKPYYPETLDKLLFHMWNDVFKLYLPDLIGNLYKKINEDTMKKINGKIVPKDRKMFIYSGHDMNINAFLAGLNKFEGRKIPYGSYISVEIHQIAKEHYVKVLLGTKDFDNPEEIWIPNCGNLCPLGKYIEITSKRYVKHPEEF